MISYAITVKDELTELTTLVDRLSQYKRDTDEIIIVQDTTAANSDISTYLANNPSIKSFGFLFKNDFSAMKNFMNSCCMQDWIFNIDADELPNINLLDNLHDILEMNSELDAMWVPRINIVEGITDEHIKKWGWIKNEKGWINWPHDPQCRIYRNAPEIKWIKPVHEKLDGYKNVSRLPDYEELAIYHIKSIARQERQNNLYSQIH